MAKNLKEATRSVPPRRADELISFQELGLTYRPVTGGTVEAIKDISLHVREGEFVAIVGPSGCGKSTLLRLAAGLMPPTEGKVLFRNKPVAGPLRSVGMVFQAPVLLPWRSVLGNVLMGVELAGLKPADYRARADELLHVTGLADFAGKLPKELSGGMQQRVALCRALILDPPLLLMDEPFGALDAMTRDDMNLELLRVWGDRTGAEKTVLFVTHSIPEAIFLADRVIVMTSRPGRIASSFDVPLGRPRSIAQRASSEFGSLSLEVYESMKVEHPVQNGVML